MNTHQLNELLETLVRQPHECEWVEFKENFHNHDEIGETISAISNGACLHNQQFGFLIFGVQDETHIIIGTTFKAKTHKKGSENLENWLVNRLNPRIDFKIFEFDYIPEKHISLFVIPAATNRPVEFLHKAFIRVGSVNRNLGEFPEKLRRFGARNS